MKKTMMAQAKSRAPAPAPAHVYAHAPAPATKVDFVEKLPKHIKDDADVEEESSDITVEARFTGEADNVLEGYMKYMQSSGHFPHITDIRSLDMDRLIATVSSAKENEIDECWSMTVADIGQWDGHEDGVVRAIMPSKCRGDAYNALKKAISDLSMKELPSDHVDDIIVYVFIKTYFVNGDFDVSRIFRLEKRDVVKVVVDTCFFNPRTRGGDELCLSFDKIGEYKKEVATVYPKPGMFDFEMVGRFEDVSSDDEDDDGDYEEEEEEDDDDDDDVVVE